MIIVVWNDSLQNLTMQHVQERDWICSVVSSFGLSIQSTSKDAIRRYGGSTAPSMPWPPEHEDGTLSLRPFFAEWKQQIYQIWWSEWKYSGLYFLSPSLCIYIYIYLELKWPLFWMEFRPSFGGFFHPKIESTNSFIWADERFRRRDATFAYGLKKLLKMHMCMENYPPGN